ncbi:MAG TPA: 16S rRNA (guanine(966)-N(2))-methyltransferase RsmD, partial [Mycobacteriales bacterium]|nr:16S rRNA (guanine(966)-N(2))-methyltransferase RsmD [Mycobacteriales bacterium]
MSRIIGGVAGGRRLQTPRGRSTRPTSDRMREGLMSALGGALTGRAFLDLFAGSGAVGLEAASRGAAPVHLVEREQAAVQAIRTNVAALDMANVHVHAVSVSRFLSGPAIAFDVVFVDPPYSDPVQDLLTVLVRDGWLAADAVVVVERSSRDPALEWPGGLVGDRSRRYGEGTLWYGRRP